jgi:hypothetical protein
MEIIMKKFLLLSLLSVSFVLQASENELAANRVEDYAAMITLLQIANQESQSSSQPTSVTGNQFTAPIQSKSGAGKKVKNRYIYVRNWTCSKCNKEVFGGQKDAIAKHRNSGCQKNHFRCDSLGLKDARSICPLRHADLGNFNKHLERVHGEPKFDSQAAYDQAVAEYNRNA